LRADLEARQLGYVLAVARDHRVGFGGVSHRVDALLARVPARARQCVSAGRGAKGQRHYDWAFVRLDHHSPPPAGQAGRHWLLVCRNRRSGELAFYRCYTPLRAPEARVVKAFNTVAASVVAQAAAAPGRLSLLYCGDHAAAKHVAAGLIVDAGFVPVDAGRLAAARDVEALGRLLADLAYGRGPGPVGYQLLTPSELSMAGE
jgi:hypothetical protein